MKKQLENPYFWAKLSGMCRCIAARDDEEREIFDVLAGLSGNDMIRLAVGYHDTEWMSNNK